MVIPEQSNWSRGHTDPVWKDQYKDLCISMSHLMIQLV